MVHLHSGDLHSSQGKVIQVLLEILEIPCCVNSCCKTFVKTSLHTAPSIVRHQSASGELPEPDKKKNLSSLQCWKIPSAILISSTFRAPCHLTSSYSQWGDMGICKLQLSSLHIYLGIRWIMQWRNLFLCIDFKSYPVISSNTNTYTSHPTLIEMDFTLSESLSLREK